jgi:hypothetical protein
MNYTQALAGINQGGHFSRPSFNGAFVSETSPQALTLTPVGGVAAPYTPSAADSAATDWVKA